MFYCDRCNTLQKTGIKGRRVVVETKPNPQGRGTQIKREEVWCPSCCGVLTQPPPQPAKETLIPQVSVG